MNFDWYNVQLSQGKCMRTSPPFSRSGDLPTSSGSLLRVGRLFLSLEALASAVSTPNGSGSLCRVRITLAVAVPTQEIYPSDPGLPNLIIQSIRTSSYRLPAQITTLQGPDLPQHFPVCCSLKVLRSWHAARLVRSVVQIRWDFV